ncbi:MAG: aspartate 1-decarboxylase [Candidatus Aminicenantales bacterium]
MIRAFLRSKIHRATVTHVDVEYEGSLSLDEDLMKVAGLAPYERIDVWNVANGERFSTYIIQGKKGSRQVGVYGAAGRKVRVGDTIIIAAYAYLEDSEVEFFTPKIVVLEEGNRVKEVR